jgi:hypothetical protein
MKIRFFSKSTGATKISQNVFLHKNNFFTTFAAKFMMMILNNIAEHEYTR